MSETLREAATFIEQGHVRVGPDTVTDPAFLVTRTFEDFVTWVDTSKVKRKVMRYNDALDDFGAPPPAPTRAKRGQQSTWRCRGKEACC